MVDDSWWEEPEETAQEDDIDLSDDDEGYYDGYGEQGAYGDEDE